MAIVNGTGGGDVLFGTLGDDELNGLGGNDWLQAAEGDDTLDGGTGNDALWSGSGTDTMTGGKGDDTYHVDVLSDVIIENPSEGTDRIHSYVVGTYDMAAAPDVENIRIVGFLTGRNAQGNALDNTMEGNRELNTLLGGDGDDVIIVHSTVDVIDGEANTAKGDTVWVDFTANLATTANWTNIENLTLGGTSAINGTGDANDNTITGNSAKNTMTGGDGNDTYVVSLGDVLVETATGGNDTVRADFTYSIAALANLENITLTGAANINATGNASVNILTGNDGSNTLNGGIGADTMSGGKGNDVYYVDNLLDVVIDAVGEGTDLVNSSVTFTLGADTENLVLTGSLNIDGTGNALSNTIVGNTGANTLTGGLGNDLYIIQNVTDAIVELAGEGTDNIQTSASFDMSLNADQVENITLTGTAGINAIGNALNNIIIGNSGANFLSGMDGDDTITAGEGNNNVLGGFGNDIITAGAGADNIDGEDGDDTITAGNGSNILHGGAGDDTITAGSGIDNINGDDGSDTINAGGGNDIIVGGTDGIRDVMHGDDGNDTITGGSGNDHLDGGGGVDRLVGGLGNDTYGYDNTGDVIIELPGEGIDTVYSFLDYVLPEPTATFNVENVSLDPVTPAGVHGTAISATGNSLGNEIEGNLRSNILRGMGGSDYLHDPLAPSANGGDDTLDGGAGADIMQGLLGNDLYIVDNSLDSVIEAAMEGTDTIQSSVSYDMGVQAPGEVENLTLTGSAAIDGTGNDTDNTITGNAGVNTLAGGKGEDVFVVGVGDDVRENAGEGTLDTVMSAVSWVLASNVDTLHEVEGLTLIGTGAINGTGNELDNRLQGNAGINTLAGGLGNDTFVIDDLGDLNDVLIENAGEGTADNIEATISYTLALSTPTREIENITLKGSANIYAVGNDLNNVLTGNDGNNTLDGNTGADTMIGGLGDDTLVVDNIGDVVTENPGEGTDTVLSMIDFDLLANGANIENLTLAGVAAINGTGNTLNNVILGNGAINTIDGGDGSDTLSGGFGNDYLDGGTDASNDTLDGGAGDDDMRGGKGNDVYAVDSALDVITELAAEGTDQVNATLLAGVTYTLSAEVENLTLLGNFNSNGTGNTGVNTITGNVGNNILTGLDGDDTLDGGVGLDAMIGGIGDDTFIVDNTGDVVTELAGEGTHDLVKSSITYTLGAELEDLTLTGSAAINGTGNAVVNTITGNSGTNTLNGLVGADTMIGLGGNDLYIVDDALDTVDETGGSGTDLVQTSVDYDMGAHSVGAVENLTLLTGALVGIGNAVANTITGNAGVNTLDGGAGNDYLIGGTGADTMTGGAGNDTFIVDNVGDVVIDAAAVGDTLDTVLSSVSFILGATEEVEIITLTGTAAINATGSDSANTITGNSAVNTLDGGAGDDTLVGSSTDILIGGTNGAGGDTAMIAFTAVLSTLNAGPLWEGIENITLTGTASLNATGDTNGNTLTGNEGKNTLDGAGGTDTLVGGKGDDLYIVDDITDVLDELNNNGSGKDTVYAMNTSYSLDQATSQTVENLSLIDADGTHMALNGTGNTSNNYIKGNALDNVLDGGAGADTLEGGVGNDTYMIDSLGDVIKEKSGVDLVISTLGFYTLAKGVENLTLGGTGDINGTGNQVVNTITGNSGDNVIDGGKGIDIMIGGDGDDTYIVDVKGEEALGCIQELVGEGTADKIKTSITFSMANHDNIEILELTGTKGIHGTGNSGDNTIIGNSGSNSLMGGGGDDTLIGGAGKDTYFGGTGADTFYLNANSIVDKNIDIIKDYNVLEGDHLFIELDIDPLSEVFEDFVEFKVVGGNTQVWVDFDGPGTDFTSKQVALIEGVIMVNN